MEKAKKILLTTSLTSLAISCIMLILAVFGVSVFEGVLLRLLLIFSTTAVSCAVAISELAVIKRKKILGYVGIGLLSLSVIMAFIVFCSNLLITESLFNRLTGIVAVSSILFIAIISIYSKLGKKLVGLQIPTYVCLCLLDIMLILLMAGVEIFAINGMLQTFIVLIIVNVGLFIASTVISSKHKQDMADNSKISTEIIKISNQEYENLKTENAQLKQEILSLKAQLDSKHN